MAKGPDAFRTISEAADELHVPQHVLRFWETKFSFIRPMKRAGGRRFYRPQDITVLRGVKTLLHDNGLSIKRVQRLHREEGLQNLLAVADGRAELPQDAPAASASPDHPEPPAPLTPKDRLQLALEDLLSAKQRLDRLLPR